MANLYGPRIVTDGLVLHLDAGNRKSYPLSGNTIYDLSGNGNNGTFGASTAAPTFSGDNGGCLSFDGSNDYVVTGNSSITGNQSWSLSVWVFVDISRNGAGRQGWIIWEGSPLQSTSQLISIGVTSGKVEVAHWSNDTIFSNSPINFGNFQNISVTFNGSVERIYVNGINTDNKSTTLSITDGAWYLGTAATASGGAPYLKGKIGQVSVYNKSLSATEIRQNFEAVKGRYGL